MASKVLKSFLIGIGYDTTALEAGDKKINASLNGIKSGALGISAALVGAFGFAASSVAGVADRVDKLVLATQNLRTPMNTVYSFGNAVKLMGGEASEAIEALKGFEEIQNNLRLKGEAGPINDLAMAGIDVSSLYETKTGEEFMRALSGMIPKLDEGQRSVVQGSLGLSDGVFRSLSGGIDQLDATMKRASELTGSIDQLTENSRKLADNSAQFGLIIEGIKNELADKFLPSLVGASNAVNSFLKEYRPEASKVIDYAAENPEATAVLGGSATAAIVGATLAKFGLNTVGGALSKAGTAGVAVTVSAVGANLLNRTLDDNLPGYSGASQEFDKLLRGLTGLDRIKGPLELMSGGSPSAVAEKPPVTESRDVSSPDIGSNPVQQSQENAPSNYKEIPSPHLDDLVRATRAAKLSLKNDLGPENQLTSDGAFSGVVDRREGEVPLSIDHTQRQPDFFYGERSASDVMPPASPSTPEEDRQASAEALAGALNRSPIKVQNQLGVTLQLDGQALETKIMQVNEQQNYETLGDLKTTTER